MLFVTCSRPGARTPDDFEVAPTGPSDEVNVTRVQRRRMHTHQRDCVLCIPVKGDHRVPGDGIIVHAERVRVLQCLLEHDHVFARIKTGDRDVANATRLTLVDTETLIQGKTALGVPVERKDIVTRTDRYRAVQSYVNGIVAVADSYHTS